MYIIYEWSFWVVVTVSSGRAPDVDCLPGTLEGGGRLPADPECAQDRPVSAEWGHPLAGAPGLGLESAC